VLRWIGTKLEASGGIYTEAIRKELPMPVIEATNETYAQLIAQPGLTLVMYDNVRSRYRNDRGIRAAFRRLARQHQGRLRVVLVDFNRCSAESKEPTFIPTFRMFRDGERIGWDQPDYESSDKWLVVWAESFLPEEERTILTRIACQLRHGIVLTIGDSAGSVGITGVGDFLAKALRHFKRHRDELKTQLYIDGSFRAAYRRPRSRAVCNLELSHPGDREDHFLTAALWTDAVIEAYTVADTVEQIAADLDGYRKASAASGGSLDHVLRMIEQPRGDLRALRHMLKDALLIDEQEGLYRPGVPYEGFKREEG